MSQIKSRLVETDKVLEAKPGICSPHFPGRLKCYGASAMPTFIMLTRLNQDAVRSPKGLAHLEHEAMKRIRTECANVQWIASYAVLGPCDYLDIFDAGDIEAAVRVSALIRTFGHAHTEIWTATEWERFKDIVRLLPGS